MSLLFNLAGCVHTTFPADTKIYPVYYEHLSKYATLHFRARRGVASLCYRNCAEINVLMCEE